MHIRIFTQKMSGLIGLPTGGGGGGGGVDLHRVISNIGYHLLYSDIGEIPNAPNFVAIFTIDT